MDGFDEVDHETGITPQDANGTAPESHGAAMDRALAHLSAAVKFLNEPPLHPELAIGEFLALAEELGHVRVWLSDDRKSLRVRSSGHEFPLQQVSRAPGKLRSMCASLAMRTGIRDSSCPIYGGVGYVRPGEPSTAGCTLKMMNTMDEHWFDLASHRGWSVEHANNPTKA